MLIKNPEWTDETWDEIMKQILLALLFLASMSGPLFAEEDALKSMDRHIFPDRLIEACFTRV